MIPSHEVLTVDLAGAGSSTRPGSVQRALAGAGLSSDDILGIWPSGPDQVSVEIATTRSLGLLTPLPLPLFDHGRHYTFTLRRADDPPGDAVYDLLLSWDDGGSAPAPGALATALTSATGGTLMGAEELGCAFEGPGWLRFSLPLSVVASGSLPTSLTLAERTFQLDLAEKKNLPAFQLGH